MRNDDEGARRARPIAVAPARARPIPTEEVRRLVKAALAVDDLAGAYRDRVRTLEIQPDDPLLLELHDAVSAFEVAPLRVTKSTWPLHAWHAIQRWLNHA